MFCVLLVFVCLCAVYTNASVLFVMCCMMLCDSFVCCLLLVCDCVCACVEYKCVMFETYCASLCVFYV